MLKQYCVGIAACNQEKRSETTDEPDGPHTAGGLRPTKKAAHRAAFCFFEIRRGRLYPTLNSWGISGMAPGWEQTYAATLAA